MKTTDYAEVFPHNGWWMVRFTSAEARARAMRLFGTNEIPTAFTTVRSFDEVHAELRRIPANAHTAFVEACEVSQ